MDKLHIIKRVEKTEMMEQWMHLKVKEKMDI